MNTETWTSFVAMDAPSQVKRALDVMAEVVTEYGRDHVYQRDEVTDACRYVHTDVPGCLIGQVLYRLGLDLDTMWYRDNSSADASIGAWSELDLSRVTLDTLNVAQRAQDHRESWGYALDLASQYAASTLMA